ncbi:BrnA antitoxin family protein [Kaistia nematophila]|nr:BrnA antitoxin family protein [Kaistia nematophila]
MHVNTAIPRNAPQSTWPAPGPSSRVEEKKPAAPEIKPSALPRVREPVSLRIDSDVLEHFQADGPGWQDRINDALRAAAIAGGLATSTDKET